MVILVVGFADRQGGTFKYCCAHGCDVWVSHQEPGQ
jgi:hypothetical protein